MDGFGIAEPSATNAIYSAKTPVIDNLLATCPHSQLQASGEDVGLPEGQIGNSEVGHTNIGRGTRCVPGSSQNYKSHKNRRVL